MLDVIVNLNGFLLLVDFDSVLIIMKHDKDHLNGTWPWMKLLLHLPGVEIVDVNDRQREAIFIGSLQLADAGNDQQYHPEKPSELGHILCCWSAVGLIHTLAIMRLAYWFAHAIR